MNVMKMNRIGLGKTVVQTGEKRFAVDAAGRKYPKRKFLKKCFLKLWGLRNLLRLIHSG